MALPATIGEERGLVVSLAVMDGITDDRGSLASGATAANTSGTGLILRKGVYRVSSSLVVNTPVHFKSGAVIRPDAGVTVTLAEGFTSEGTRAIFDHSAGGVVAPQKISTNHPRWWGKVNTADDSSAWRDAYAAMQVSGVKHFTTPAGISRIWGISFSGIAVVATRDDSILPVVSLAAPGDPLADKGYMIKIRTSSSITGGQWRTGGVQGITVILYTGHRAFVKDAWIRPTGADTIGIHCVSESGGSVTPVLDNLWLEGISGTNPGTPGFPTDPMGTGILSDSADGRMTQITVAYLKTAVRITRGSWVIDDLHIWNCAN